MSNLKMNEIAPDKEQPSYINYDKKNGLFLGFIYILVFGSILGLIISQTSFYAKYISDISSIDDRLKIIEEQISIADEINNDSLTDISANINFLDKEIRKLWDLSNKRNKKDITVLKANIEKLNKISSEINSSIVSINKQIELNKSIINNNSKKVDGIEINTNDILVSNQSIQTQIILIDDTVKALNNYKTQLNQALLEIQTKIQEIEFNINNVKKNVEQTIE